jgi:hypothetical protein
LLLLFFVFCFCFLKRFTSFVVFNVLLSNGSEASGHALLAMAGFVCLGIGFDCSMTLSRAWALAFVPPAQHASVLNVGVPVTAAGTLPIILLSMVDVGQLMGVPE